MRALVLAAAVLALAAPARAATFTIALATAGPVTPLAVVTSTPGGIVCPGTCSATFTASATVVLGEVHPSTMAFVGWAGLPGCLNNASPCTLTLRSNLNPTARFAPKLDLGFAGIGLGVVTSTGVLAYSTQTAPGTARSFVYPAGTAIVLNASTGTGSAFVGWTGGPGCGTASTCTFTLNGYTSVIATFTASAATYALEVVLPLGGGAVTSSPAGIACPGVCRSTFTANAAVTLTTAAAAGYRFAGWANGGCRGLTPCVVHSTSPLQGLGGKYSPSAYFYPVAP